MLGELRGAALLAGWRGAPAADVDAASRAVSALSRYGATRAAELEAIDINPLIVLPAGQGVRAVDVLVVERPGQVVTDASGAATRRKRRPRARGGLPPSA